MAQKQSALNVVQQSNSDSEEDEEQPQKEERIHPKAPPREPIIDDDGFELVQKPRRR